MKTAEEIFTLIQSKAVTKEMGIKLVENYGIRRERNVLLELKAEAGFFVSEEIQKAIERIIEKLNKLYEMTAGAEIK